MWPAATICDSFQTAASVYPERLAIRHTVAKHDAPDNATDFAECFDQISYTWKEYQQNARGFAKALIAQGVSPQRAVTIQGANSPQWLFANIGTILAGGISAGVYPTNGEELSKHTAVSSQAEVVVVEDEKQLKKYEGLQSTALKCFVVWKKCQIQQMVDRPVYSWDAFIKQGEQVPDALIDERMHNQKPDDVCSLIYTSGTTGLPKAAALTHDNLRWAILTTGSMFRLHADHHGISYLPLSHIAAQQLDCIGPVTFGYSIDIAPADALKGNNLKQHLVNARPTYFLAVPRVWEKFKEGIEQKLQQVPWYQQWLFAVATTLGRWAFNNILYLSGKDPAHFNCLDCLVQKISQFVLTIFDCLVFSAVKRAMGLDRCEIAASGAGILDPSVVDFFASLNMRIIDIFGMSETSGPACVAVDPNTPRGSCGKALEGMEIKIASPDEQGEGEVCFKGRNIFRQYLGNPLATAEAFDAEGYFKSGDKGRLDDQKNLFITGRLKELIKTAGGENIPPVRIEQKIQQELSIISNAVVIGDRQKFLTCLLTLKSDPDSSNLTKEVLEVLEKLGSSAKTCQEAADCPLVFDYVQTGVERANRMADSQAQSVQKCTLVPEDFTVANGLMTPTLKLRRSEIAKRYKAAIDVMYA